MSVFFNGRLLTTPAVESMVYDGGMASVSPGRANNVLMILGTSESGLPKTGMYFDSPVGARRALRAGPLLKAVEMAFNPSSETGSPARVGVVRIEDATQSQIMLKDAGSNNVILLKSADYGAHTNGVRVTIEAGSLAGLRPTVQHDDLYFTKDNLRRSLLSVLYSGVEATATVTVNATKVILAAPANTGTPIELSLINYQNVRELCDAINARPGWSTTALIPEALVQNAMDGVTAGNAKTALTLTANLQAVVDWFNQAARELVFAERQTGALAPPAVLASTFLSGGGNGTAPDLEDWQDGFDALQEADIQWVVPLSASPDVWAMADAHVMFMSTVGKMERRAFVGGDLVNGTLANAISDCLDEAVSINSDRTALVFPPILDSGEDGSLQPFPAYYLAAKIAGGFAAMNPGNTMTNKVLNIRGLDPMVANLYDSDTLISGGITGVRRTRRGFVVSKAISTWLANDNYNRVEISTGVATDYVARTVREALEIFIGRKASPITLHEALARTESILRDLARPEPVGLGVIVGDAASPAYRNIQAEIMGDILRVWFECSPVIPINFVLVSVYAKAYSGRASAAAFNG